MHWTESRFEAVMHELVEDNPVALRPLLTLAGWEFDSEVPTLAVTLGETSVLKVNPKFLETWCTTDNMAKAAVLHEFLHLLLGHTLRFTFIDDAHNIAFDAVVNAIIHRQMGGSYSVLFANYYKNSTGPLALLRPPGFIGYDREEDPLHRGLYDGTVVADDILDLLDELQDRTALAKRAHRLARRNSGPDAQGGEVSRREELGFPDCIGNHNRRESVGDLPSNVQQAMESVLRSTHGNELGRQLSRNDALRNRVFAVSVSPLQNQWKRAARAALQACLDDAAVSQQTSPGAAVSRLPVLSTTDRRGFLRVGWSPFLPESDHHLTGLQRSGAAQVYLDVSDSIREELRELVQLLHSFRGQIARPLWTFADTVARARFEHGVLVTRSSDGTNIHAVLEHVAQTRPPAALIVTDGVLGSISKEYLEACHATRLCALVTGEGDCSDLRRARIPFHELDPLPS